MSRSALAPRPAPLRLPLILAALLTALVVAACGGQTSSSAPAPRFEGTWVQNYGQPQPSFKITRSGDTYSLTGPGGESPYSLIMFTTPDQAGKSTMTTLSVGKDTKVRLDGDTLAFSTGGREVRARVNGDRLSLVVPTLGSFVFSRVAGK